MPPEHCLQLLDRDLKRKKITVQALQDTNSAPYLEMVSLLKELSALPSWGNGRDIKTLAKTMVGMVYKTKHKAGAAMTLSPNNTVKCFKDLLKDRKARDASVPSRTPAQPFDMSQIQNNPPSAPTPTGPAATRTKKAAKRAPPKQEQKPPPPKQEEAPQDGSGRDDGVSDAVWNLLQADKLAEEQSLKRIQEELQKRQEEIEARKAFEEAQKKIAEELAAKKAKDEAERQELMRRMREARLAEERARIAREKAAAELERRKQEEMKKRELEAQAQQKLRHMGVCCQGFVWIKQASGYRCAGGSHYVSNAQLGM